MSHKPRRSVLGDPKHGLPQTNGICRLALPWVTIWILHHRIRKHQVIVLWQRKTCQLAGNVKNARLASGRQKLPIDPSFHIVLRDTHQFHGLLTVPAAPSTPGTVT